MDDVEAFSRGQPMPSKQTSSNLPKLGKGKSEAVVQPAKVITTTDALIQAAIPSRTEKAGDSLFQLIAELGMGGASVRSYLDTIKTYSSHSSDSEGTSLFKNILKEKE